MTSVSYPSNPWQPQWLHAGASESALTWVCRWFCVLWLARLLIYPLGELTWLPAEMARPVFPLTLLSQETFRGLIQSETALAAIRWVAIALVSLVLFGNSRIRTILLPLMALTLTVYCGLGRIYSYINHAELGLLICTWFIALEGWLGILLGKAYRERHPERVLFSITLLFCMTYSLVGSHRMAIVGLSFFQGNTLDYWLVEHSLIPGTVLTHSFGLFIAQSPILAPIMRGMFALATLLEVFAPLVLFSTLYRRVFVAVLLPMHLGIYLLMNIAFVENMAMFILFIPMGKTCQPPCIVLFDGVCSFCDRFVQWIIPRDPEGACYMVASQSEAGEEIRERYGISQAEVEESVYVVADGRVYNRSSAMIQIAERLALPWRVIAWARVIPTTLRDRVYDVVSANRYRWFGKRESCRLPTQEEQSRFLREAGDVARHFDEGRPERASRQNP